MGGSANFLKAIAILANAATKETSAYLEHPSDDYQRGRALASQQLRDKVLELVAERPSDDSEM